MGRRDGVQVTLEVVSRMRYYLPSLVVSYEPGWETRGNGTSPNYDFGNVHHTGFPSSLANPFPAKSTLVNGRPDLSGPLANESVPACTVDQPRLHVIAANPANHAGASRASGPVPALSLYNPRTRGLEIDYAGTVAMLAGQLLVAHVWTRAVADVLAGGDVEHVRAHAETSVTGKWDPGAGSGATTLNMAAFRAAAAALTPGDDDMLLFDAQARNELKATNDNVNAIRAYLGVLAGKIDGVATEVQALMPGLVAGASSDDLALIAKLVNDERDRRERDGDPTTGAVPTTS